MKTRMRTDIQRLGEFGLIRRIQKRLRPGAGVICGSGDDAAVYAAGKNVCQLLAIDTIVEDVDFKLREAKPELIGRKAVAVNLSDIAAMGGTPRMAVMSLVMPKKMKLQWVDRFLRGTNQIAKEFGVSLIGGDLSSGTKLVCTVAMTGEARRNGIVYRKGARPGDLIVVSGRLGGSILGKHLQFTPRVREGQFLAGAGVSSMIDISDGLVQDLNHLAQAGDVGYELDLLSIPVSRDAVRLSRGNSKKAIQHALYDGEDFELLFTVPPAKFEQLKKRWEKTFQVPLAEIGRIVSDRSCRPFLKSRSGFQHF